MLKMKLNYKDRQRDEPELPRESLAENLLFENVLRLHSLPHFRTYHLQIVMKVECHPTSHGLKGSDHLPMSQPSRNKRKRKWKRLKKKEITTMTTAISAILKVSLSETSKMR